MNNTFTKEALTAWVADLMESAERDESFSVSWFGPTKNTAMSIIGGWSDGYDPSEADLFYLSKSNPTFGMCIKVISNNGPYMFTNFDILDMPVDANGEVEDTCITLEWGDDPEGLAEFFMVEWERLTATFIKV